MAPSIRPPPSARSTHNQVSLARRLLFPTQQRDHLPPLLASDAIPQALTDELYDFIALALRAFVAPWWSKITPYDKEFIPEITRVIAVVARNLESRLQQADLASLIYRDIPLIATQHYQDFRNASSKTNTAYAGGGSLPLNQLFHQLQPHIALSQDGKVDPNYIRQFVDHILKTCLPLEDYTPEAERFIIREVLVKVVVGDIIPKITQPWFIHRIVLDVLNHKESRSPKVCSSFASLSSNLSDLRNLA